MKREKYCLLVLIFLFDWTKSESLPYDEIELWKSHPDCYRYNLEDILNTSDDSDIGHFVEVDLRDPDEIKEKAKNFPPCPVKKN